jgi:hypothetical protein
LIKNIRLIPCIASHLHLTFLYIDIWPSSSYGLGINCSFHNLQNVLVEQILEPGKRVTVAMGTNRDITTCKSPPFVPGNKHGYADVPCKSSLLFVEFRNLRCNMDILLSTLGSDSHLVVQYYEYQEKIPFIFSPPRFQF